MKAYDLAEEQKRMNYYSKEFFTLVGITAQKHGNPPVDVDLLKKVVEEKYMGIFDLAPDWGDAHSTQIANIINFIDEKS